MGGDCRPSSLLQLTSVARPVAQVMMGEPNLQEGVFNRDLPLDLQLLIAASLDPEDLLPVAGMQLHGARRDGAGGRSRCDEELEAMEL
eukprot:1887782-Prymnesium_polylepis.1